MPIYLSRNSSAGLEYDWFFCGKTRFDDHFNLVAVEWPISPGDYERSSEDNAVPTGRDGQLRLMRDYRLPDLLQEVRQPTYFDHGLLPPPLSRRMLTAASSLAVRSPRERAAAACDAMKGDASPVEATKSWSEAL